MIRVCAKVNFTRDIASKCVVDTLKERCENEEHIRHRFFYQLIFGNFFLDLGSGGRKKIKKSSENDQLTGHFQRFFFSFSEVFFFIFRAFYFLISPEQTLKLVKCANSLYYIFKKFHNFPA